jgi:hypothetical protein
VSGAKGVAAALCGFATPCAPLRDVPPRNYLVATALAVCILATAITGPYAVAVCHDLPRYYHHGLPFLLWTCAFLAVWLRGHAAIEACCGDTPVCRWLKMLGRNVALCYVVQWLLIGNMATALYQSESLLQCVLSTVALLTLTSLAAYAWECRQQARGTALQPPRNTP